MNIETAQMTDEMEEKFLKLTLDEVFQILHSQAKNTSHDTGMMFLYRNVRFEISCELLDKVVPRGFEE